MINLYPMTGKMSVYNNNGDSNANKSIGFKALTKVNSFKIVDEGKVIGEITDKFAQDKVLGEFVGLFNDFSSTDKNALSTRTRRLFRTMHSKESVTNGCSHWHYQGKQQVVMTGRSVNSFLYALSIKKTISKNAFVQKVNDIIKPLIDTAKKIDIYVTNDNKIIDVKQVTD